MSKSQLQHTQHDPIDTQVRKTLSPAEYYNLHIRKEGQPILTDKDYAELNSGYQEHINELYSKLHERKNEIADVENLLEPLNKKYQ